LTKLKDFVKLTPYQHVVLDNDNKYRIAKTAVSKQNELVWRYYLPTTRVDRLRIKAFKQHYETVSKVNVYEL